MIESTSETIPLPKELVDEYTRVKQTSCNRWKIYLVLEGRKRPVLIGSVGRSYGWDWPMARGYCPIPMTFFSVSVSKPECMRTVMAMLYSVDEIVIRFVGAALKEITDSDDSNKKKVFLDLDLW